MAGAVLHISPALSVMGGISAVLNYLRGTSLARERRLVFVASHRDGSKPFKLLVAVLGLAQTFALLCLGRVGLVHIHCGDFPSPKRKYFYFLLVRLFGKPVVLHLHGALFLEQYERLSPAWKARMRAFFEGAQRVVCLSESWSAAVAGLFPGARRVVIPNGIPLPGLEAAAFGKSHGGPLRLAFLGLIGARKGTFDLLAAFRALRKRGIAAELALGGNGEVERLRAEIAPLQGAARYLGWISGAAKERLLRESDVYCLPSYGEGMPMSVLEAMSYGLAVVSTRVGGIPELVEDGVSGLLVEAGDVDALTGCLERLARDPALRERLGRAARQRVEERHDVEGMGRRLAALYAEVEAGR